MNIDFWKGRSFTKNGPPRTQCGKQKRVPSPRLSESEHKCPGGLATRTLRRDVLLVSPNSEIHARVWQLPYARRAAGARSQSLSFQHPAFKFALKMDWSAQSPKVNWISIKNVVFGHFWRGRNFTKNGPPQDPMQSRSACRKGRSSVS